MKLNALFKKKFKSYLTFKILNYISPTARSRTVTLLRLSFNYLFTEFLIK
jgi:hypothetical protein